MQEPRCLLCFLETTTHRLVKSMMVKSIVKSMLRDIKAYGALRLKMASGDAILSTNRHTMRATKLLVVSCPPICSFEACVLCCAFLRRTACVFSLHLTTPLGGISTTRNVRTDLLPIALVIMSGKPSQPLAKLLSIQEEEEMECTGLVNLCAVRGDV